MSRSQQNQTFNQSQQENQDYNTNAQAAYTKAQGDIGTFQNQLSKFSAANPYTQGGAFQTAQNQVLSDVAAGGADATKQAVEGASVRTGSNLGGAVAGAEEVAQNNQRTLGTQEAQANQERIAADTGYNQTVLGGAQTVQSMQDQLAAQQAGNAQGALGTQEQAAQQPSFSDMLGTQVLIPALNAGVGIAACPAEGSLYLMHDGTSRLVEQLCVGDRLMAVDGDFEVVTEIQSGVSKVLAFETQNGCRGRASRVHALALPSGGFAVLSAALGKVVRTASGDSRIASIVPDGEARVYNVITDNTHTYCADGIWALGVGEAEREVSMNEWNAIADRAEKASCGRLGVA